MSPAPPQWSPEQFEERCAEARPVPAPSTAGLNGAPNNSRNDAAVKAEAWIRQFGTLQTVPTAVLSGVFKKHNLVQAQEAGLTIFWAHDLAPLGDFILSTQ